MDIPEAGKFKQPSPSLFIRLGHFTYRLKAFSAHENTALDGHTESSTPPLSLQTPQRSTCFSESSLRSHPTL